MSISKKIRSIFSGEQQKPKTSSPTYEQQLNALAATILAGIKTEEGEAVFFEGSALQEYPTDVLQRLGAVVLEGGVHVEIAQVCDGINAIGGAENPRIRVTPRGLMRPLHRNIIFGDGYPDEEPFAQSFTLLDNPIDGQTPHPGDSLLSGILSANSPLGIASGIGPLH